MAFMSNIQWDGVVKPTFVPIDSVFKVKPDTSLQANETSNTYSITASFWEKVQS